MNKRTGSRFDDFLEEEGILDDCQKEAEKRLAGYKAEKDSQKPDTKSTTR